MIQWTGEAEPGQPFWWANATWPDLDHALPETADLLIIGAGYTGLSAAIAAHDAGAKVVVLDAGQPGKGASTRNGGMAGAHPRLAWENLQRKFGAEVADGVFAEAAPSLQFVRDLIAAEGIECDFQDTGRIQLAWTQAHFAAQQALAAKVNAKSDVKVDVLERHQLGREINTPAYFGGIVFPEHCALHPWKYHNGMLEAVLRRGVPIIAHCPVTDWERRTKFWVSTSKGQISADKLLLATNGYTAAPFQHLARRVFPLPSYLIATEELDPDLIAHLAPGRRMMVETRARFSYFRIAPDGRRFLFGGRAAMVPISPRKAARRLHATLCEVWPELHSIKISHAWSGNTGYSFSHMPQVGQVDGMYYAMGYSGSGTVMAPYLGMKAAYCALGDPKGQTAYSKTHLSNSWLHPTTRPHFLQLANLWYRLGVDQLQNWQACRDHSKSPNN